MTKIEIYTDEEIFSFFKKKKKKIKPYILILLIFNTLFILYINIIDSNKFIKH